MQTQRNEWRDREREGASHVNWPHNIHNIMDNSLVILLLCKDVLYDPIVDRRKRSIDLVVRNEDENEIELRLECS